MNDLVLRSLEILDAADVLHSIVDLALELIDLSELLRDLGVDINQRLTGKSSSLFNQVGDSLVVLIDGLRIVLNVLSVGLDQGGLRSR